MFWIILIIVNIVIGGFATFKFKDFDRDEGSFLASSLVFSFLIILIGGLTALCYIGTEARLTQDYNNIEIKKQMLSTITEEYQTLKTDSTLINVANNNYMAKRLEIMESLMIDIESYNNKLAQAKFRNAHPFWFIGFNGKYTQEFQSFEERE